MERFFSFLFCLLILGNFFAKETEIYKRFWGDFDSINWEAIAGVFWQFVEATVVGMVSWLHSHGITSKSVFDFSWNLIENLVLPLPWWQIIILVVCAFYGLVLFLHFLHYKISIPLAALLALFGAFLCLYALFHVFLFKFLCFVVMEFFLLWSFIASFDDMPCSYSKKPYADRMAELMTDDGQRYINARNYLGSPEDYYDD